MLADRAVSESTVAPWPVTVWPKPKVAFWPVTLGQSHLGNRERRGEGTGMAIFVTFGDKLGYTLAVLHAIQCEGGILPCKINMLEVDEQRNFWHPKCNLTSEVQRREI